MYRQKWRYNVVYNILCPKPNIVYDIVRFSNGLCYQQDLHLTLLLLQVMLGMIHLGIVAREVTQIVLFSPKKQL
jgi:hypothetical protein